MAGLITYNGYDLAQFGVMAVRGSYNDFLKLPSFKESSTYSWEDEDNEDTDLRNRRVNASDVTITFLLSANTVTELMSFRSELINLFQQDGWQGLYIDTLKTTYYVYYKSCDSATFINATKKRIKLVCKFRMRNFRTDF